MGLFGKLKLLRSIYLPVMKRAYANKRLEQSLNSKGLDVQIDADFDVIDSELEGHNRLFGPGKLANSQLGLFSYIQSNSIVAYSKIGRYCSIGPYTIIAGGEHPVNFPSTHPVFFSAYTLWPELGMPNDKITEEHKTVNIGHDVWIGAQCYIRDGVTIGTGSVIAAGSVVVDDIAPYSIVAGVPAKVIRLRFSEQLVAKLVSSKWWEKDIVQLKRLSGYFRSQLNESNIDLFINEVNKLK